MGSLRGGRGKGIWMEVKESRKKKGLKAKKVKSRRNQHKQNHTINAKNKEIKTTKTWTQKIDNQEKKSIQDKK